ncbi:MAG TPA: hypothetical protein VLY24_14385 [Bryobacteraceae bacterium]|nr:hypothetical protein [Bryobacteraceae bacterium]
MGSIANVPSGIACVSQLVDSITSSPSSQSLGKILQSASPSDAVEISQNALKLQEATGIFGLPAAAGAAAPTLPTVPLPGGATGATLPTGVSASDVSNATPEQQATIAEQAQALQQVQNMFYPPLSAPTNTNVLA